MPVDLPEERPDRLRRRPPREIERWVQGYADDVYRLAFTYLKSAHDADDIVQTVFLKALSKAPDFENSSHERAWFIRVTANACKDVLRDRGRRPMAVGGSQDMANVADAQSRPAASASVSLMPPEGAAPGPVTEAVLGLPTDYREAIFLHYYAGYSTREVAFLTESTEVAVRARLSRARKKLRMLLKGGADEC